MKLISKEIEANLPRLYSQENVPDPVAVVKFFDPCGRYTFYVLEGRREPDGDFLFFGFCRSRSRGAAPKPPVLLEETLSGGAHQARSESQEASVPTDRSGGLPSDCADWPPRVSEGESRRRRGDIRPPNREL